ncbi:FimV/HubP family polar landmark protein [Pokkaliibacter sp. MBI-7]|uniref:FimV/HubP family polar landmark protein n=1 Tax=Pokkaliibacter sp. MBI-7 TaxID=3040600 RepID=UPI002448772A|nr:FimV/HubP family polar landmark protein [Pokkaliibacter sp. MBI-7]MDH2435091.1 FimV/HubP family polar landmark protein [Pokkaliibacter sp. MBI-7]
MLRKLTTGILLVGALQTGSVWALTLGDASLGSFLNEPLNAELPLNDVAGLDLSQLKVQLADQQVLKVSGIQPSAILSNLRFRLMQRGNQAFIQVTSSQPMRDTYLNFVVEVSWPQGKLAREYTLFFDPPAPSVKLVGDLPEGAQANSGFSTPDQPFTGGRLGASADEGAAREVKAEPKGQTSSIPGKSVKVGRNDTLWTIAARNRPNGVSPQQVMLAFQRVNPQAFIDGNINRIRKGSSLQVPTLQEIRKLNFDDALKEVARQNQLWRGRTPAKAALTSNKPASAKSKEAPVVAKEEGQLRLMNSASGKTTANVSGQGDTSQLKAQYEDIENKLSLAQESLDKSEREKADLSSRLDALTAQVNTIEKLLKAKDDQLASLQASLSDAEQQRDKEMAERERLEKLLAEKTGEPPASATETTSTENMFSSIPTAYLIGAGAGLVALLVSVLALMRRKARKDDDGFERIRKELEEQMRNNDGAMTAAGVAAGAAVAAAMMPEVEESKPVREAPAASAASFAELDPLEGFDDLLDDDLDLDIDSDDPFNQVDDGDMAIEPEPARPSPIEDIHEDDFVDMTSSIEEGGDVDLDDVAEAGEQESSRQIGEFDEQDLAQSVDLEVSDTPDQDEEAFVHTLLNEPDLASLDADLDGIENGDDLDLPVDRDDNPAQDDIDSLLDQTDPDDMDTDLEIPDLEDVADLSELEEPDSSDVLVEEEPVEESEDDLLSLDDELNALLAEADQDGFVEEEALGDEDFTFLSGADEVATKLDLARAYLDMEDADGARDILNEVMIEGSESQKQEAEELLASLV